jgi:tetratricopeptide (TPR) repeat protein
MAVTQNSENKTDDLFHKAESFLENREFDLAIEIYRCILHKYSKDNPVIEHAHCCLGDILLTLGRIDEGEKHIREALAYDHENHQYHHLLGFIHYTRYQWDDAYREYKFALDKQPWNVDYINAVGRTLFNAGDHHAGLQYLHQAMQLAQSPSAHLEQIATAYLSMNDAKKARYYAKKAVADKPDNLMAWIVLMKTYTVEQSLTIDETN